MGLLGNNCQYVRVMRVALIYALAAVLADCLLSQFSSKNMKTYVLQPLVVGAAAAFGMSIGMLPHSCEMSPVQLLLT